MDLEKHASLRVHSQAIKDQILMNSETKKQQKLDYLEEGRKVRQKLEEDKMKVEGIKQRKLGELKTLGIHDKYQHDLAKKKIQWAKPPKTHTSLFNWKEPHTRLLKALLKLETASLALRWLAKTPHSQTQVCLKQIGLLYSSWKDSFLSFSRL